MEIDGDGRVVVDQRVAVLNPALSAVDVFA